jgi:hypothetical protein
MNTLCNSCYLNIEDADGHLGKEGPICCGCFQAGCGAEAVAAEEAREAAELAEAEQEETETKWDCPMCTKPFEFVEYQYDDDGIAICKCCFETHFPEAAQQKAEDDAEDDAEAAELAKAEAEEDNDYCPLCNNLTNTKNERTGHTCCKCLEETFCDECGDDCEDMDCSHDWETHWVCCKCAE